MNQTNVTLWQVIDSLAQQIPFSKQKVETALSTPLFETDNTANDLLHFFKLQSPPVVLAEGVIISDVNLRIRRRGGHPGLLGLDIGGACITLEQIRVRYDQLKSTGHPRGGSLDEKWYYAQELPWGSLSFGFAERNPDCLASVGFGPKENTT